MQRSNQYPSSYLSKSKNDFRQKRHAQKLLLSIALILGLSTALAQTVETLGRARSLIAAGDHGDAIALLNLSRQSEDQSAEHQFLLALASVSTGDFATATPLLRQLTSDHPTNGAYQTLFGRSLFESGQYEQAAMAFSASLATELPQDVRNTVKQYLASIRANSQQTQNIVWTASIGLGGGFDTNANKATDDSLIPIPVFGNLPFSLRSTAQQTPSALLEYDLSGQVKRRFANRWEAHLGGMIRGLEYSAEDARLFDQHSYRLNGGLSYAFGRHQIIASMGSRWFTVDKDLFRRTVNTTFAWRFHFSQRTLLTSYLDVGDVQYHPQSRQSSRDVTRWIGGASATHVFGPKQNLIVSLAVYGGLEDEASSRAPHIGRKLIGVNLAPQWLFNQKIRLFSNFSLETSIYNDLEPLFLKTRDDTYMRVIGGLNYKMAKRWSVEPTIEYLRNRSNVPTSDYDSLAGKMTMRYKFN